MFKDFILIFLIIGISSKKESFSAKIEFDTEQHFDKNNYQFNFTNEEQEVAYFLFRITTNSSLNFRCICKDYRCIRDGIYKEIDFIVQAGSGECNINIDSSSASGTLYIHPFNKVIKADLENKKYGIKNYIGLRYPRNFPPLVFSISNLNKDIETTFYYEPLDINSGSQSYTLKNPFEICQEKDETDCKKDIKEYTFIKGNNYKIKVKNELVSSDLTYYMPKFSFYKKEEKRTDETDKTGESFFILNGLNIYLILFLLL